MFLYFLLPIWLNLLTFVSIIEEQGLGAVIDPGMALTPFPGTVKLAYNEQLGTG